jgi:fructose-bisphosphate aldolase/6-deoxy-5-ketofructose 1-phosphate synthase
MKKIKIMEEIKRVSQIRKKSKIRIPLTVPIRSQEDYMQNYMQATKESGNLFLFAGDQKIEHLNEDFYGKGISSDDANPEHLFNIASKAQVGAFATQLGLIAQYARDYRDVNYVVKLNSRTNVLSSRIADPVSLPLHSVEDVVLFQKNSGLSIVGVGYTIYLGSQYEAEMLTQAAQVVLHAHQNGLLAILWMYPRGKSVKNETDAHLIAGAAGVGVCLGADFVKVNSPKAKTALQSAKLLKQATRAAGRTGVICAGGQRIDAKKFLKDLYEQIHIGGVRGCAVGRNIHQKNLSEAVAFCKSIAAVVVDGLSFEQASKMLNFR